MTLYMGLLYIKFDFLFWNIGLEIDKAIFYSFVIIRISGS